MAALSDGTHLYPVRDRRRYGEREGFRITELALDPGQCIPWHRHTTLRDTFYVIEGNLRLELRDPDESLVLRPTGTTTVMHGRPHRVSSGDDRPVRFLVIGDTQGHGPYDYEPLEP